MRFITSLTLASVCARAPVPVLTSRNLLVSLLHCKCWSSAPTSVSALLCCTCGPNCIDYLTLPHDENCWWPPLKVSLCSTCTEWCCRSCGPHPYRCCVIVFAISFFLPSPPLAAHTVLTGECWMASHAARCRPLHRAASATRNG